MPEQEPTVRVRDYLSLLWIVAAAVLGMSLLCGVAAMGINDINNAALIGTPTVGIVNFVISNMNTLVVETAQGFPQAQLFNTLTPSPTDTSTVVPTGTHVIIHFLPGVSSPTSFLHVGPNQPQPTNVLSTPTVIAINTLIPTTTPKPPPTNTLIPTNTNTPVPDTNTPIPDTDTPVPPPTLTPIPDTPVDTPIPDTPIPDTPVDTPIPDTPSGP